MKNQKIIKSGLVMLVALEVLSTMAVIPVSAQTATYPDGFELAGVPMGYFHSGVVMIFPSGAYSSVNINGDGLVCELMLPPSSLSLSMT